MNNSCFWANSMGWNCAGALSYSTVTGLKEIMNRLDKHHLKQQHPSPDSPVSLQVLLHGRGDAEVCVRLGTKVSFQTLC